MLTSHFKKIVVSICYCCFCALRSYDRLSVQFKPANSAGGRIVSRKSTLCNSGVRAVMKFRGTPNPQRGKGGGTTAGDVKNRPFHVPANPMGFCSTKIHHGLLKGYHCEIMQHLLMYL